MNGQGWVLITSLAGVLIGGGLTFAAQWINQRAEARRHTSTILEARRAERLHHLVTFIKYAQEAEFAAYRRHHGLQNEGWDTRANAMLDDLWTTARTIQVLCPDDVGSAARELAGAVHRVVRQEPGDVDVSTCLRPAQRTFLEVAKRHLHSP
jgi:hypothetical protein